jgi:hypothetical protein
MKKVVGVLGVGGALLLLVLWSLGRAKTASSTAAASAQTSAPSGALLPGNTPAASAGTQASATTPNAGLVGTGGSAPAQFTDATTCARLSTLCSTSNEKVDADECERKIADARKVSGVLAVERSESCVAEATTCSAATGCLSGGMGMGALGEFLKGFGSALSK